MEHGRAGAPPDRRGALTARGVQEAVGPVGQRALAKGPQGAGKQDRSTTSTTPSSSLSCIGASSLWQRPARSACTRITGSLMQQSLNLRVRSATACSRKEPSPAFAKQFRREMRTTCPRPCLRARPQSRPGARALPPPSRAQRASELRASRTRWPRSRQGCRN